VKLVMHLQLIKFWRACAAGTGVCGGAEKNFGPPTIQRARSVCVSRSASLLNSKLRNCWSAVKRTRGIEEIRTGLSRSVRQLAC